MAMTRHEAIQILDNERNAYIIKGCQLDKAIDMAIEALSSEAVSREEYEETDGVITIEKQSAKDVGEIKHIVVCHPNYTRYFYNDSMPTQYKGGEEE